MARLKKQSKPMKPGVPKKPEHLSEQASKEWDRLVGELQEAGLVITVAHRALLVQAATISADIAADFEELKKDGRRYWLTEDKGVQMHPAIKHIDGLRRDLIKVLSALGLRPGVAEDRDKEETLEDLLNE